MRPVPLRFVSSCSWPPGVVAAQEYKVEVAQGGPAVVVSPEIIGVLTPRAIGSSTTRASRSPRSGSARRSRRRRSPPGPRRDPVPVPGRGRTARRVAVRRRGARLPRPDDRQGGLHPPLRAPAGQRRPSRRQPVPRLRAARCPAAKDKALADLPRKQLEDPERRSRPGRATRRSSSCWPPRRRRPGRAVDGPRRGEEHLGWSCP